MGDADRIVIAGAGPSGIFAALVLGRAGHRVTVFEKGPALSAESRASTFHPATLEILDRYGLAEPVVRAGLVAPRTQFRDRTAGPVATFDLTVLEGETPFPFRVQLEQSKFTPMVLDLLESGRRSGDLDVEVVFGTRVIGASNVGDGVVLNVRTEAGEAEVHAPWLLAADGAHSLVRESLGIDMIGERYEERFLVISVADELDEVLTDLEYVNYVADPQEWLVLLRTPDHWRVLFPVVETDDAAVMAPSALQERLRGVADLGHEYSVLAASLYIVQRRVAERLLDGNVMLIGDAAHQNSPLGGMGMNSGIQDAFSAATRLDAHLRGAERSTLETFDRLRREIARDYVQRDSHANWEALREADPTRRDTLQAELRRAASDPHEQLAHARRSTMLDAVRGHL